MIISYTRWSFAVFLVFFIVGLAGNALFGQDSSPGEPATIKPSTTRLWFNSYGNIQLKDNLFWVAQTHIRFQESERLPMFGQLAQVYNRHALNYVFSKKFNLSLGGVLRLNFNPDQQANQKSMVPEWRIWHEYQFAMPFPRLMVYHRLRIEHRWSKSFEENSSYIFRNRWRYRLNVKIPLNNTKLVPGTFYVSPEAELIMQSGNPVVSSPMEDLRLHTSFGYIHSPRLILATGLMYSTGQQLTDGAVYNQKWTLRLHAYFFLDMRKNRNALPDFEFPSNFR